jgi:hypothetical protein
MESPTPVSPPAQTQTRPAPPEMEEGLLGGSTTPRFLRTYGFQVLAVLLGIALAFM